MDKILYDRKGVRVVIRPRPMYPVGIAVGGEGWRKSIALTFEELRDIAAAVEQYLSVAELPAEEF